MSPRNYFGLLIILVTIIGLVGYGVSGGQFNQSFFGQNNFGQNNTDKTITTIDGFLGWEKRGFFEDQEVKRIFQDQYSLNVNIHKKGSIEMVRESTENKDYLFPSNKIATQLYLSTTGKESETIFFSPIVVYSWKSLLPDLQDANYVTVRDGINYLSLNKLITDIEAGSTWQAVGGKTLQGRVTISSTDPAKSSSGNLFSSLVLSTMTGSQSAPTLADLTPETKLRLQSFFDKMGLLDSSSGDIFDKFLTLGRATYPFVVGYESQLIEVINSGNLNVQDVTILYPEPTVWAEHGFIDLTESGSILKKALMENERLSEIAWQKYGLRKIGITADTTIFNEYGIASELQNIILLPKIEVMEEIISLV